MTFLRPLERRAGGRLAWPTFSPAEIACRGTGKLLANEAALDRLRALQDRLSTPLDTPRLHRP